MKLNNILVFLFIVLFSFESGAQSTINIPASTTPVVKPEVKKDSEKQKPADSKTVDKDKEKSTKIVAPADKTAVKDENKDTKSDSAKTDNSKKTETVKVIEKKEETITRKVVYKEVLPGFKAPPKLRLSARGPNAISGGVGLVSGLTDSSTGGFALGFTYNYMIGKYLWADFHLGFNFGGDCKAPSSDDKPWSCSGLSGFGSDVLVGITYRFLSWPDWEIPLNPYARVLTGISFIVGDGPNDGAALVVKTSGGLRYSFTEEFAVSAELGFKVGPAFRYDYGAGAFISIDFLVSAEYSF